MAGYRIWMTNGDKGTKLASTVASIREKYTKLDLRVRPAEMEGAFPV